MLLRWVSMCVWALVAASAVFWGLRLFTQTSPLPAQTQVADTAGAARGELSRVLGAEAPAAVAATPPEPAADARFNLVGVLSLRGAPAGQGGVALISVDGKPPKAYRPGAVVDGQNVLQAVSARGASLGPRGGPGVVALNIPPPQVAATGQFPMAGQPPVPAPAAPSMRPMQQVLTPTGPAHAGAISEQPAPPNQMAPQIENNRSTQLK